MLTDDGKRIARDGKPESKKAILQLSRLETLTDVVYALVLWRLFTLLPVPEQSDWGWATMGEFVQAELATFAAVAIGLAFTIIYWIQNNALMGDLERTNPTHTVLAILQIFFLLVFLGVVALSVTLEPSPGVRALESAATAVVGISGAWAWSYAIKDRRLLSDHVSDEDALAVRDRISAEPLTALVTLPLAFFPLVWELGWLSYPLLIRLVRRRRLRREAG
jgi:uncharacterized membrane protein